MLQGLQAVGGHPLASVAVDEHKQSTDVYELEEERSCQSVLKKHDPVTPSPLAVEAQHQKLSSPQLQHEDEVEPPSPEAAPEPEDLEEPTAAANAPEVPTRFRKELLFQQPTNFFELEAKRSYQRTLQWSIRRRISEIDHEEETLRYVQLRQTYKILRKYQVSQMS